MRLPVTIEIVDPAAESRGTPPAVFAAVLEDRAGSGFVAAGRRRGRGPARSAAYIVCFQLLVSRDSAPWPRAVKPTCNLPCSANATARPRPAVHLLTRRHNATCYIRLRTRLRLAPFGYGACLVTQVRLGGRVGGEDQARIVAESNASRKFSNHYRLEERM